LSTKEVIDLYRRIVAEVSKAVISKDSVKEALVLALIAGGHVLIEGSPGTAKTKLARSFAEAIAGKFKRIQFTPDMMPADITGFYAYSVIGEPKFIEGPIFSNIVLADELNRTTPRTQSALLEAMQEYQVTLEGETEELPAPFIVIATENPIEYEGTFPLPEAQLDRFMVKLSIGYPKPEEEDEILRRRAERKHDELRLQAVMTPENFLAMRAAVEEVYVDADVRRYMVDLVAKTRRQHQIVVGGSPRGSLALFKLARAWAAMAGRRYVTPDDIMPFVHPALDHRIILDPSLWEMKTTAAAMIDSVVKTVPVPVFHSAP
jgi:MoxR-like ATPase